MKLRVLTMVIAKVVAFYEQKLGKKAANNGGKYMIALPG